MTKYNEAQQALVNANFNQITLGSSGAGSGKSTTLVGRTLRALEVFPKGDIIIITFTRLASKDLTDKLKKALTEEQLRRIQVGTFHSIIAKQLRFYANQIGLSQDFTIMDENASYTMFKQIIEENWQDYDIFLRPLLEDPNKKDITDSFVITLSHAKMIANFVSNIVNMSHPEELVTGRFSQDTLYRLFKTSEKFTKDNVGLCAVVFYDIFRKSLIKAQQTNALNYDHILFIGYMMSKNNLFNGLSNRIVHALVDEYQDTNLLQDIFVDILGKNGLTLLGDIDQSIYEFRGGRPDLMNNRAAQANVMNLTTNYRSYQPILNLGNNVIKFNNIGKEIRKPLIAAREIDGDYLGVHVLNSTHEKKESNAIIAKIKKLNKDGMPFNEMAILVRSRLALVGLNKALAKEDIPINDTTQFADFMKSEVVQDTLNFLKVFVNPQDEYAFLSIIDRPKKGIGPMAIKTLRKFAEYHEMSIIEFILSDYTHELTPALRDKIQTYVDIYYRLLNPESKLKLADIVEHIYKVSGYRDWLFSLKAKPMHEENIKIFFNIIEEFQENYDNEKHNTGYTLYDMVSSFIFEMSTSKRKDDEEGVVISTIHGSKGLEWDYVFLLGLEEGSFPGKVKDINDMEAERRLMYVAVTRARRGITLCYAQERITSNNKKLNKSVFLDEVFHI